MNRSRAGSPLARLRKAFDQWLDGADDRVTRPAFVLGPPDPAVAAWVVALGDVRQGWAFPAGESLSHDEAGRLRSPARVASLVRLIPADVAVFDALRDSHLADRLLALHPGARAVWLYRPWRVAAAAVAEAEGEALTRAIAAIAAGEDAGWRGERLPDALREQVRTVARAPLHPGAAAALDVYLRHSFFFALGLDRDPRVRLVRVESPADLAAAAAFLGLPAPEGVTLPSSPPLQEPPPEVVALAEALDRRLRTTGAPDAGR